MEMFARILASLFRWRTPDPPAPVPTPPPLTASEDLLEFLKGWEGFKPMASADPLVPNVMDIGHGHVLLPWEKFTTITREGAHALLVADVAQTVAALGPYQELRLMQQEFDAIVSLAFNVGPGREGVKDGIVTLKSGAPSTMLRLLREGNRAAAAEQFPRWNLANGMPIPGLSKRRAAERMMFLYGEYGGRP